MRRRVKKETMSTLKNLSQNKRFNMKNNRARLNKDKENIKFKGSINSELKKNNAINSLGSTGKNQVGFKGGIGDSLKKFFNGEEVTLNEEQFKYLTDTFYQDEPAIVKFWESQVYKTVNGKKIFAPVKVKSLSLGERVNNLGREVKDSWKDIINIFGNKKADKPDKELAEDGIGNLYKSIKYAKRSAKAEINGPLSGLLGNYKAEKKVLQKRKQFLEKISKCTEHNIGNIIDNAFKDKILEGSQKAIVKSAKTYIKNKNTKDLKRLIKRNFATEYKNTIVTKKVKKILRSNYISKLIKSPPKYGSNTFSAINRVVSGSVSSIFVAGDFFNYSMYLKNDPEAAKKESRSKFKQELCSRVGLTAILTYITASIFRDKCDASLKTSVGLGLGVAAFSEIVGRALTGRLFFHKRSKNKAVDHKNDDNSISNKQNKQKIAFAGRVDFMKQKVSKNEIFSKLALLKEIAHENKSKTVEKVLRKENSGSLTGVNGSLYFGDNKSASIAKNIIKSVFFPINWALKKIKSLARLITQNEKLFINENVASPKEIEEAKKYLDILSKSVKEKAPKIDPNNIKYEDLRNFIYKTDGSLTKEFKKLKDPITEEFGKQLSKKANSPVAYDPVALGSLNKVLGSALAALFYAFDAFKLGLENSDGDYGTALKQARGRIVQDSTRVGVSSWFVAGSNNMFSWINNHSIMGAAALTGSNVAAYEAATRLSVGMPIAKHSQKELIEIDEKHKNQKGLLGSYYKVMSRLTGKKPLSAKIKKGEQSQTPLYPSTINAQPLGVNTSITGPAGRVFYRHFKEMSAETAKIDDKLVPERLKQAIN